LAGRRQGDEGRRKAAGVCEWRGDGFILTYLSVTSNTNDFSQKTQNNGIRFSSKIKRPKNDSVVQNYISAFTTSTDSKRIKIRVLI
jgi:hypothetical protein